MDCAASGPTDMLDGTLEIARVACRKHDPRAGCGPFLRGQLPTPTSHAPLRPQQEDGPACILLDTQDVACLVRSEPVMSRHSTRREVAVVGWGRGRREGHAPAAWTGAVTTTVVRRSAAGQWCDRDADQLLDTTRGRIVTSLRRGGLTADDLATSLRLTRSGVRAHISAMERDGVVQRAGKRPGTTRPSHVFELTPEVEQLLSKAYIPVLMHLVDVCARALPRRDLESLIRQTGSALARELSAGWQAPPGAPEGSRYLGQ